MSGIFDQVINYAPPSLLLGTVTYKGTWSAATNTPTLPNPPSAITNGNYYVVSAAGTQFSLVFNIGDWIISNGSAWEKVDNTDAVSSVFGRTGAVVGVSTDYSAVGITATAVGASSPSTGAFTTLSATTPLAVASGGTGVASSTGTTNVVLSGSPTITTPVIAQINDANGNETLKLASIASAVNEVTIENAATGNAVHISATGGDASVGLHLAGKGASGYVNVQDSTDATKRIMFNASGGTTNTRTMLSSTQTVDRTLSLPDATDTLVGKATTDTLTNKTLTSPTITGGALNGTLGATTPSSVAATTGTFSSTLGVTGVATLGNGAILGTPASGTVTNLTGTASININGTVGATTPSTVAATTGTFSGSVTLANGQAIRGTTTTPATGQILTLSGDNNIYIGAVDVGGNVIVRANAGSTVGTFSSTGLNSTAIGATTPSTGAFTTLSATGGTITGTSGPLLYLDRTDVGTAALRINALTGSNPAIELYRNGALVNSVFSSGADLVLYNSGNVAVVSSTGLAVTGTLSATSTISTSGTETNVDAVRMGSTGRYGIGFNTNAGGYFNIWAHQSATRIGIGFDTGSYGTFSEKLTVLAGGNVGIGTTSPATTLQVYGTGTATQVSIDGTGRYKYFESYASGTRKFRTGWDNTNVQAEVWADASAPILFATADTEQMRLLASGSLVIGGTDANGYKLKVQFTGSNGLRLDTTSTTATAVQFVYNVVNQVGTITTTTTATAYNTSSDYRLKENVQPMTGALAKVAAFKPVTYTWKANGSDGEGFLAHELAEVCPHAVTGEKDAVDENGNIKPQGIDTSFLVATLTAAIQELTARLAALEAK